MREYVSRLKLGNVAPPVTGFVDSRQAAGAIMFGCGRLTSLSCHLWLLTFVLAIGQTAPGIAADYKDTNDYVTRCGVAIPSQDCVIDYQIAQAAGNWGADTKSGMCPPTPSMSNEKAMMAELRSQVRATVAWLKKHPDVNPTYYGDGITTAGRDLFPCTAAGGKPSKNRTVRQFLAQCPRSLLNCSDWIVAVEVLDSVPGPAAYCAPKGSDESRRVTKGVTTWLKAHPAMKSAEDTVGIEAALKALYPCGGQSSAATATGASPAAAQCADLIRLAQMGPTKYSSLAVGVEGDLGYKASNFSLAGGHCEVGEDDRKFWCQWKDDAKDYYSLASQAKKCLGENTPVAPNTTDISYGNTLIRVWTDGNDLLMKFVGFQS